MRAHAVWAVAILFAASSVCADGGRIRLRQDAGPFAITVFAQPDPLVAGPADVSVLVQDRVSGDVVPDASVEIRFREPHSPQGKSYAAAAAANRLLRASRVDVPYPGRWLVEVTVRRGAESAAVSTLLTVEPRSRARSTWPYLAVPPIAVALYAAGGALGRRRRRT